MITKQPSHQILQCFKTILVGRSVRIMTILCVNESSMLANNSLCYTMLQQRHIQRVATPGGLWGVKQHRGEICIKQTKTSS